MPFCPDCLSEYRPGSDTCAACGTVLIDELPPGREPVEWVTVEETGDKSAATIVEGFLGERGVPVRVLNRHDREAATPAGGLSPIEVQVPVDHLGQALGELETLDDAVDAEREGPVDDPAGEP